MANVKLSQEKARMLDTIMTELEIPVQQRAVALRLAFAKGIDSTNSINIDIKNGNSNVEFSPSVISKKDNSVLIEHLIIKKIGQTFEQKKFRLLILAVVERGIEDMYNEIVNLPDAETYLFYLLNKHQNIKR